MQEKSYSKKSYSDNTLEEESINLLEWDSLKTHLSPSPQRKWVNDQF